MSDKKKNEAQSPFASNIPRYFIYISLKGFGFGLFVALWVIYLQQMRGLTLSQAALLDVTFFVAAAVGEIPTGIVADTYGRKTSLTIGAALLTAGILGWTFAPTIPLVLIAYVSMGIGLTFLTGAEDAFFYETIQITGREAEYSRLVGRAGATFLGGLALGSALSGLFASINLTLPFLLAGLTDLVMLGVVLSFKEPKAKEKTDEKVRKPFRQILGEAVALVRSRPTLRYMMFYLALIPIASFMVESVFLQPQALALGVPLAAIGMIWSGVMITNMAGSNWADRVKNRLGEVQLLYIAPAVIIGCMVVLGLFQIIPALVLIAVMGFFTSMLRPILMNRIQAEVADDIRATIISLQSLMFTFVGAISQPSLGFIADRLGLPIAYFVLAGALSGLVIFLLWRSRRSFPQSALSQDAKVEFTPV